MEDLVGAFIAELFWNDHEEPELKSLTSRRITGATIRAANIHLPERSTSGVGFFDLRPEGRLSVLAVFDVFGLVFFGTLGTSTSEDFEVAVPQYMQKLASA